MEEFKVDPTIAYDVVELPSRGIHYPTKKKSLRIAYLTASDENILASPNLVQSNGVVNELLKRKVLDKDISTDDLVEEDRQAILLFLRNTAFGSDYKMLVTDPKTGERFSHIADLSQVKLRDFKLEEDSNGEFKFYLEKSKTDITFKFLTQKQQEDIDKIKDSWNGLGVAPVITRQLEMMIKSVGGIKDQLQIRNFIERMPIKDSQDFRKYILENKPSLDLVQHITTPSGETVEVEIGFGVEFFRPFYGL
jgi:hypothetical protein